MLVPRDFSCSTCDNIPCGYTESETAFGVKKRKYYCRIHIKLQ